MTHVDDDRQSNWPWLLLLLILGIGLAGLLLFFPNREIAVPASWGAAGGARNGAGDMFNAIQQALISPGVAGLFGVLIIRKKPRHRIGWLLITIGLTTALTVLLAEWAARGYFLSDQIAPSHQLAAWISNWIWLVLISLVFLTIAVFPSGHFLSRRWQAVTGISVLLFLGLGMIAAAIETPMSSAFQIPNPYVTNVSQSHYDVLFGSAVPFMVITTGIVLAGTFARYRRGLGLEQRQIKWLLVGVAVFAIMVITGILLALDSVIFLSDAEPGSTSVRGTIGAFIVNSASLAVLIGIGIAMVRHQLYDVDFLIRRTTSYAILTGLLALIYFSSVLILQQLLTPLTRGSTPAVVLSTLLIATLFLPIRRRVQEIIDRRFFRQKYNAQKTLEAFAATVRNETDLDALTAELVRVIEETMQPEQVSLWIKPATNVND